MTKIDVTLAIRGWDGEALVINSIGITLRSVCLNSLGAAQEGKNKRFEEKILRFELGMRLQREDEPNLSAKEISTLQDAINEAYPSALIAVQAHRMLEPGDGGD